jgi:hypothetical protein
LRGCPDSGVSPAFLFFVEHFVKCIIGVTNFNRFWRTFSKFSDFVTPTDEAFGLLLLMNSEDRWNDEKERIDAKEPYKENDLLPTKYSGFGQTNKKEKGFTKKFSGWKQGGIDKFNELLELVKESRYRNGSWFDEEVIRMLRDHEEASKQAAEDQKPVTRAGNDLFDDSDYKMKEVVINDDGDDFDDEEDSDDGNFVEAHAI